MSESSLSLEDFKPHTGLISMGFGGAVAFGADAVVFGFAAVCFGLAAARFGAGRLAAAGPPSRFALRRCGRVTTVRLVTHWPGRERWRLAAERLATEETERPPVILPPAVGWRQPRFAEAIANAIVIETEIGTEIETATGIETEIETETGIAIETDMTVAMATAVIAIGTATRSMT